MSLSLEDLWKTARDEELIDAVGRWESTNENAQRVLTAEVKRRGLKIAVPEVTVRPTLAAAAAPSPMTWKGMLIMAVILAIVAAIAALVG